MKRNDAVENAFLWRQPTRWAQLLVILFLIAACAGSAAAQTTTFNDIVKDLTRA